MAWAITIKKLRFPRFSRAELFLVVFFALFLFSASAQLPPALQKIQDYNNELAASNAVKITFIIAFLAGILGILSPCILPFLPAYFAYTFKEKRNITQMTLIFFLGFSLVFVSLGVLAGFLGEQTLQAVQNPLISRLAGFFLIFLGLLIFFGRGLSSLIKINTRFSKDSSGTFLFGMAFALGWSACLGPILSGILAIGALLHNTYLSALLLFFYSLGNFVPIFILSFFYDSFDLGKLGWINRTLRLGTHHVPISSLISSLLFLSLGLLIVIFGSTSLINTLDLLGTKPYFYSLQNQLSNFPYATIIGALILMVLLIAIAFFIIRTRRRRTTI